MFIVMIKKDFLFIVKSFLIWRVGLLIIAYFSIKYLPLFSHNYFGGGYSNYVTNPLFWGHLNFDGEHYLAIARDGYKPLEYFFFPVFPILMNYFSIFVGLVISNLFFLITLVGIYKLVKLDYEEQIAKLTIVLFLVFPTSFYFGTYYTESIFLSLVIWSFLFARQSKFFLAALLAAFASATRVIGVIMFPVLILELLIQKKKNFWPILISPLGILIYMYYLQQQTGDLLIFFHQIAIFGEQRSSGLVLLPQVVYRYIFKIFPALPYNYFPILFTTYLEASITLIFLILIVIGIFKLRLSYSFYATFALIIPTLVGSFSSMPRYALVVFPVFILISIYLNKLPKIYTYFVFSAMLLLLVIAESLFWRGYWLS
jgi:Gpi18-like mannosyltransferase